MHRALENAQEVRGCAIQFQPPDTSAPRLKRIRLYGLPCPKCGSYYFSDEPNCPVCEGRSVNSRTATSMRGMTRAGESDQAAIGD